jgi:hypothetical protein
MPSLQLLFPVSLLWAYSIRVGTVLLVGCSLSAQDEMIVNVAFVK